MKIFNLTISLTVLILSNVFVACDGVNDISDPQEEKFDKRQIEKDTKKLLNVFLDTEDMVQLESLLDDAVKFHWPDKSVLDKENLMKACTELVEKHDNKTEIIDLVIEENRAFVLFVWSGVVKEDSNPKIVGKEFSIHDCYRLTWKDGKIIEWYTIWGSMDYLLQLGYTFNPPVVE